MPEIAPDASVSPKAIVYASLTATATALAGGTLITLGDQTAAYGATMFIGLPAVTGVVAGCFARPLRAALIATLISVVLRFVGLFFTGLEGVVCILMAAPLILATATLGAGLGWAVRKKVDSRTNMLQWCKLPTRSCGCSVQCSCNARHLTRRFAHDHGYRETVKPAQEE